MKNLDQGRGLLAWSIEMFEASEGLGIEYSLLPMRCFVTSFLVEERHCADAVVVARHLLQRTKLVFGDDNWMTAMAMTDLASIYKIQ